MQDFLLVGTQIQALNIGQASETWTTGGYRGMFYLFAGGGHGKPRPHAMPILATGLVSMLVGGRPEHRRTNTESTLRSWWEAARELVHKKDKKGFDTLVILTAWTLWKQRNTRAFNNTTQQRNVQQMQIKDEFEL
jgi:hypothetical protein